MSLKLGDPLPEGVFTWIPPQNADVCAVKKMTKPETITTDAWKNLKVILFSLPGAFTPVCSSKHLPDYLLYYDQFKSRGVDVIAVVAINDPFVMAAWGDTYGARDKILFLTDNDACFSRSIGGGLDLTAYGMGQRTSRYAVVFDAGTVTYVGFEPDPGAVTVSGAEAVLAALDARAKGCIRP